MTQRRTENAAFIGHRREKKGFLAIVCSEHFRALAESESTQRLVRGRQVGFYPSHHWMFSKSIVYFKPVERRCRISHFLWVSRGLDEPEEFCHRGVLRLVAFREKLEARACDKQTPSGTDD